MSSIEHQMTEIYCFVDDYLKAHPGQARWRRSQHSEPRFSDSEVITLALLQGSFQVPSLKQTYRIDSRAAFYLIDSKPIPLCHSLLHRRVRLF